MAIRCSFCGRNYDVTLFEFGNTIKCECGHEIGFQHREITEELEDEKIQEIKRFADKIAFLIVSTDYPKIDIEIEKEKFRDKLTELFPDKAYLYELIYEPRFQRLKEQFGG
jgi:DNA-directed RNA polymerase subunit RPC12/RpoP